MFTGFFVFSVSSVGAVLPSEDTFVYSTSIGDVSFISGEDGIFPVIERNPALRKGDQTIRPYVPGEVIVVYEEPAMAAAHSTAALSKIANAGIGATVQEYRVTGVLPGYQVVSLPESMEVDTAIAYYENQPGVKYAQPDYLYNYDTVPNDPSYSQQWGLKNTGQTTPYFPSGGTVGADINAEDAWDVTTGSDAIVIAVLDTGVDYLHEDLVANMWDDGSGHCGYDFFNDDDDPMDDVGHGTHCAGIISAKGSNGIGVTGVCWDARIMALKIGDIDGCPSSCQLAGIDYAVAHGADVLSCSWGGPSYDTALKAAIENSGLLVVCAAGNDGEDNDAVPHYPSSYDSPNIISVAASSPDDTLSSFSNYGATSVDIAAPGYDIYSTIPREIEYEMTSIVFSDDMSSLSAWEEIDATESGRTAWHLDTTTYTSAPSSTATGPYGNDWNQGLRIKDRISLAGMSHPGLRFKISVDTEYQYDYAFVLIWEDGATENNALLGYTGDSNGFIEEIVDLSDVSGVDFTGKDIRIVLGLLSDESFTDNGVWYDDMRIGQLEEVSLTSQYEYYSGTSMATPMVSGVAGLVMAAHPEYTWQEVKAAIIDAAEPVPALAGKCVTGGRLYADPAGAIPSTLNADFAADTTSGNAPLTVQFTDMSAGVPVSWAWDFGNGDTSTEPDPTCTYTDVGTYSVSLTVTDSAGSDTETKDGYITVVQPGTSPVIRFSPSSSPVHIGNDVVFSIVLDSVPDGLAGYNLTLSLRDAEIGEIMNISAPAWASLSRISEVPGDSVWISSVDLGSSVNPDAEDVLLGEVTVRGDAEGSTELAIIEARVDDDSGNLMTIVTEPATLTVNTMVPFPGCSESPTDPDNDGIFEDINGNGRIDFADVVTFFNEMEWIPGNEQIAYFDFNTNGRIDFNDVVQLFHEV